MTQICGTAKLHDRGKKIPQGLKKEETIELPKGSTRERLRH